MDSLLQASFGEILSTAGNITGRQVMNGMQRLSHCFKLYDAVRIDHFRGFDQYSIPYGAETAITGHWEQGPGIDLFNRVRQVLGEKEVIAEDLGYVTDSVRKLVHDSGFPGMKVLEFAFDSRDSGCASDYLLP